MTRERFLRLCETADTELDGDPLYLAVDAVINRDLDRAVVLRGSWHDGSIVQRILYTSLPGRQGIDCYIKANELCDKAVEKCRRWLEFHYGSHVEVVRE